MEQILCPLCQHAAALLFGNQIAFWRSGGIFPLLNRVCAESVFACQNLDCVGHDFRTAALWCMFCNDWSVRATWSVDHGGWYFCCSIDKQCPPFFLHS